MKTFFRSFYFAFRGVLASFRGQRNIKIELAAGVLVTAWSLVIRVSVLEFAVILFLCFFVIILEMLNTAVENTIDQLSPRYNRRYGEVKDILAGAVLLASILSVIIGLLILWKPSLEFLKKLFPAV